MVTYVRGMILYGFNGRIFNSIMKKIKPKEEGWTALAYYYNLCTGWYDKSP